MKIATWNVNSVRARQDRLLAWLQKVQPDVACLQWGLIDVFRQQHPEDRLYSWWDYRMLAFPKNDGLRLDYIFATRTLAARCTAAEIDRKERKGEKLSDHAPVVATFRGDLTAGNLSDEAGNAVRR